MFPFPNFITPSPCFHLIFYHQLLANFCFSRRLSFSRKYNFLMIIPHLRHAFIEYAYLYFLFFFCLNFKGNVYFLSTLLSKPNRISRYEPLAGEDQYHPFDQPGLSSWGSELQLFMLISSSIYEALSRCLIHVLPMDEQNSPGFPLCLCSHHGPPPQSKGPMGPQKSSCPTAFCYR